MYVVFFYNLKQKNDKKIFIFSQLKIIICINHPIFNYYFWIDLFNFADVFPQKLLIY